MLTHLRKHNYEVESEDKTTVTKAYASEDAIELVNAKSIVVTYGDKSVCTELGTVTSGGGTVKLAVELQDIPAADKDNVTVCVSSTEISTAALITYPLNKPTTTQVSLTVV